MPNWSDVMQGPLSFLSDERNLFGVCAALGHDFGFNPLFLRVVLGVSLLWNPEVVISAYLVTGVVVYLSHWLFPDRSEKAAAKAREAVLI